MITFTAEQQALLDDPNQEAKLVVTITATSTTLRYCTGGEPFVISGNVYYPRGMHPSDLEFTSPQDARMTLEISNSDNAISTIGNADRSICGCPIELRIYLRRKAAKGSWLLLSTWSMNVSGVGWNAEWARFTMTGFTTLKPHHILTVGSRTCSNVGGDGRCQYGSDIVCGGSWEECEDFSNTVHFNGFRYAPNPDTTIELNYFTMNVPGDFGAQQQTNRYRRGLDWLPYPSIISLGPIRDVPPGGYPEA